MMSRDSSKGNAPVTMVTSVPRERERDIAYAHRVTESETHIESRQFIG